MYELVLQFLTQIFGLMYSVLTEDLSDFSPHSIRVYFNSEYDIERVCIITDACCILRRVHTIRRVADRVKNADCNIQNLGTARDRQCSGGTRYGYNPHADVLRCPQLNKRLIEAMGGQAGLLPNIDESSPGGVAGAIGELLSINILTGILYIAVIISGLVLLLTVFGRFLKIYVYMSIARFRWRFLPVEM